MALFSILAKLGFDGTEFDAGLKRANSAVGKFGSSVVKHLAAYVTTAAFIDLTRRTVEYASHLDDLSKRLGVTTDSLQEFSYAARLTGGSIDDVVSFFERLSVARRAALEGGPKSDPMKAFSQFDITAAELKTTKVEDLAKKIAKAFEGANPQQLIAPLRELGGKGAGGLIPAFSEGLGELAAQAHEFQQVMSPEAIANLDEFGDKIETLTGLVKNLWGEFISKGANQALNFLNRLGGALGGISTGLDYYAENISESNLGFWDTVVGSMKEGIKGVDEEIKGEAEKAARKKELKAKLASLDFSNVTKKDDKKDDKKEAKELKAETFANIPATKEAAIGGFFFGADATSNSLPRQHLEETKVIRKSIVNIESLLMRDVLL